jgi:hypothetical protein
MALPQGLNLSQTQNTWATALDPIINFAPNRGLLLSNIALASGANVVNHKLGRKLQGWIPVRVRASATLYDTQDTNQMPQLTLNLTASAAVVVDLWVF